MYPSVISNPSARLTRNRLPPYRLDAGKGAARVSVLHLDSIRPSGLSISCKAARAVDQLGSSE